MINFNELAEAMGDLDEDSVVNMLEQVMEDGGSQAQEAMEACQKGMDIVGKYFEDEEYFVGDLIYAGELMSRAVDILKSALISGTGNDEKTNVILCTVAGDLHDIGKNIVRSMMEAGGFEVNDLGIDVEPQRVLEEVKRTGTKIVLLSGVLTLAIDSMKETVDLFKDAGIRDDVKVMVGGAPLNDNYAALIGADDWARTPQETLQKCRVWASEM